MFAIQLQRNPVQRVVCMLLAACIVTSMLTTGAVFLQALERSAAAEFTQHA